jgi:hypothetical protein
MIIAAQIISAYPPSQRQFLAYSCNVLQFIIKNDTDLVSRYPACQPVVDGTNTLGEALQVAVQASFRRGAEGNQTEQLSAALHACFPMAGWLATVLHVVGTEVYLKLTPKEAERLRRISYERQVSQPLIWSGYRKDGGLGERYTYQAVDVLDDKGEADEQLEKGLKNPGNSGLTVERLGDAKPWHYEH